MIKTIFSYCCTNITELMSGAVGNLISAFIGGLFAFWIAKVSMRTQKNQLKQQAEEINIEKEKQLLWQMFFDIKRDFESLKLWDKYMELLNTSMEDRKHSNTGKYLTDLLPHTIRDLKGLLDILAGSDLKGNPNDYHLLWERSYQLLSLIKKFFGLGITMSVAAKQFDKANELYENHIKLMIPDKS